MYTTYMRRYMMLSLYVDFDDVVSLLIVIFLLPGDTTYFFIVSSAFLKKRCTFAPWKNNVRVCLKVHTLSFAFVVSTPSFCPCLVLCAYTLSLDHTDICTVDGYSREEKYFFPVSLFSPPLIRHIYE
jgi:hypothetical protein